MPMNTKRLCFATIMTLQFLSSLVYGQARVQQRDETITTYPFGDPDPVTILARSAPGGRSSRLYPYSFLDRFTSTAVDKEWTVVRMENPWIKLSVLPQVGGKIWGATEKSTDREFVYTNDVVKFRQIALRGPWTSGGIEFNFGVVGHAPSCATPVDYVTQKNPDGSVSCIVGTMDLPSRTRWSVAITLPKDKAYFQTQAFWYNQTALNQSYYVWMNGAVRATDDLQNILPGRYYIGHDFSVPLKAWPTDTQGRDLSWYRNNRFGSHKSFFTVGEYENFYGGYWHDWQFGFGHWALYDDMSGQKLWLWALSRQGGIWEDLLTDKHGQYTEPQAGRYFNQNDHEFFEPYSADTWKEIWFPYKKIGPMVTATPHGVLSVRRRDDTVSIGICALTNIDDDLTVKINGKAVFTRHLKLRPMKTFEHILSKQPQTGPIEVKVADKLSYCSDPASNDLHRPIKFHEIDENTTERLFMSALKAEKSRNYHGALQKYLSCLEKEPAHVRAMCRAAELYYRRGQNEKALFYAEKALSEQMYDHQANYIYGVISRMAGRTVDAKEAFGWAARSMQYRSNAYCQMAEVYLLEGDLRLGLEYAQRALDYNRYNVKAYQVSAVAHRKLKQKTQAKKILRQLMEIDPLNHFIRYETCLLDPTRRNLNNFHAMIRNEFPQETYLELALYYVSIGFKEEAIGLLKHISDYPTGCYWLAWLHKDFDKNQSDRLLQKALDLSPELVFPFRLETIFVLQWAQQQHPTNWKTNYYLGLIYWSKGRFDKARTQLTAMKGSDYWPAYICRANLNKPVDAEKALGDFEKALETDRANWRTWHHLITFCNESGKFNRALELSQQAINSFPKETTIRLDLIRTLAKNKLWKQALDLLEDTSILPFEGAQEIHNLFAECQIQLALGDMYNAEYESAISYLDGSKEYPERLGSGRPYDPDFRMQDFLKALCYDKNNENEEAENKRKDIYAYTVEHPDAKGQNKYFGALILKYYGEHDKAEQLFKGQPPAKEILELIETVKQRPQKISYGVGQWESGSLGNHRVVLEVKGTANVVAIHIPWRRRDLNPEKKGIVLIDSTTGKSVNNVYPLKVNREYGDYIFQPATTPSTYYLYYLPHEMTGRSYPKVSYISPEATWDPEWVKSVGLNNDTLPPILWDGLPKAKVVQIQSIDEFNSFYPMEVIATAKEVQQLLSRKPDASYLLFPEDRKHPVRMTDDLPLRWIERPPTDSFTGKALRGEFYAFQIGLYAARNNVSNLAISFSDLTGPDNSVIPSPALRCFNIAGVDWQGRPFEKKCSVEKGEILPFWFGVTVPTDAVPGRYQGIITITSDGTESENIKLTLDVDDQVIADAGDSEPWRHSRLRWLDSTIAMDDEVVAPFAPLEVTGNKISCLGRSITIGKNGFPLNIESRFAPEVTHLVQNTRQMLALPVNMIIEGPDDKAMPWKSDGTEFVKVTPGSVVWQAKSETGPLTIKCTGKMEFDGFVGFTVKINSSKTIDLNDIRLEIPFKKDVAKYMMGMGLKGGLRPTHFEWKWNPENNHDAVWIGDVNAGLQCSLQAQNYSRPLNTNFYLLKPLNMPPSWYNQGRGGCNFTQALNGVFTMKAYSGPRTLVPGQTLYYNFNLLITPFKPIDTAGQWETRYYHSYKPTDEIAATGANTINVHHANDANPYINYPFIHTSQMKEYVDAAHDKGLKVKIYYTVRELSNRAAELFALRSLGDEILSKGPGGGYSWLQEHLGDDYIAGWFVPRYKDAAVINSGVSRWHNYYLEGLNWLTKNIEIDGLYIDDVAFDRGVMKRARKILDRNRPAALIDLHSANQYNTRDGFVNSANLYLEHFPYINRLWFGEYFDYDSQPDYWLIEVSGIPFGLMGEMLQDGGNPWRGMVYGMTARMPREQMPQRLWKLWDDFGILQSQMIGYWSPSCPVRTNHEKVLATAYVRQDKTLISLASWADTTVNCKLHIDWDALHLNADHAHLKAIPIEDFQPAADFNITDTIRIEPGKGWLLILTE